MLSDPLVIRAIIGEASDQGFEGMTAVAEGIRNRGHLRGVYGLKSKHIDKEPRWVWEKARKAWERSKNTNLVKGGDHWENVKEFGEPDWAPSMEVTAIVKDHVFYKERGEK